MERQIRPLLIDDVHLYYRQAGGFVVVVVFVHWLQYVLSVNNNIQLVTVVDAKSLGGLGYDMLQIRSSHVPANGAISNNPESSQIYRYPNMRKRTGDNHKRGQILTSN